MHLAGANLPKERVRERKKKSSRKLAERKPYNRNILQRGFYRQFLWLGGKECSLSHLESRRTVQRPSQFSVLLINIPEQVSDRPASVLNKYQELISRMKLVYHLLLVPTCFG